MSKDGMRIAAITDFNIHIFEYQSSFYIDPSSYNYDIENNNWFERVVLSIESTVDAIDLNSTGEKDDFFATENHLEAYNLSSLLRCALISSDIAVVDISINSGGDIAVVAANKIYLFYNNQYIKNIEVFEEINSFAAYEISDSDDISFIYSGDSNIYIYNLKKINKSYADPFINFELINTLPFSTNKIAINNQFIFIEQISNKIDIYTLIKVCKYCKL